MTNSSTAPASAAELRARIARRAAERAAKQTLAHLAGPAQTRFRFAESKRGAR